jgi:hypothetical protein
MYVCRERKQKLQRSCALRTQIFGARYLYIYIHTHTHTYTQRAQIEAATKLRPDDPNSWRRLAEFLACQDVWVSRLSDACVCVCARAYACIYVHNICVYIYLYICICVYIQTHIRVLVHTRVLQESTLIQTHIRTYTHIHTRQLGKGRVEEPQTIEEMTHDKTRAASDTEGNILCMYAYACTHALDVCMHARCAYTQTVQMSLRVMIVALQMRTICACTYTYTCTYTACRCLYASRCLHAHRCRYACKCLYVCLQLYVCLYMSLCL